MKRLLALAAFLLASTAAQAQYTFEYGGRTIHIDPNAARCRSRASTIIPDDESTPAPIATVTGRTKRRRSRRK